MSRTSRTNASAPVILPDSPFLELEIIPGHTRMSHCHWQDFRNNDWNLLELVDGCGVAQCDEIQMVLRPRTFYLFAPTQTGRWYRTERWEGYWCHFTPRLPIEWPALHPGIYALTELDTPPLEVRRIHRNLMEINRLARSNRDGWYPLAGNLIENILLRGNLLAHHQKMPLPLQKAVNLLNDFSSPRTMDEIAEQIGMSRSSFYCAFRSKYGISPRLFREQRQFHAVCQLLTETSLPLREIARSCGFPEMPQFFLRFKTLFGVTPGNYRETHGLRESVTPDCVNPHFRDPSAEQ
ncbi:MAG: AraC family transcriptional regulator [Victivallaceae bacterium]|nr:AraC family transcriptional regulator [Victivallaceae bacterium]